MPSFKFNLRRGQRGNTVLGVIIGMVVALFIAMAVAVYINKTPIPFVNKGRLDNPMPDPEAGQAPDPNRSLYGRDVQQAERKAAQAAAAQGSGPMQPVPQAVAEDKAAADAAAGRPPVVEKSEPAKVAKADSGPLVVPLPADDRTSYYLQAGAFRDSGDADGMKAKLVMLGFEVKVAQAEVNGNTVYRVRMGPYARLDDMNRVRTKLAENGVEVSVVKLKQP